MACYQNFKRFQITREIHYTFIKYIDDNGFKCWTNTGMKDIHTTLGTLFMAIVVFQYND